MAIAIDVARVHRFITEADQKLPPEQQTTFLLGVVSAREQAELHDILFEATLAPDGTISKGRVREQAFNYGIIVRGLRGWENFRDAKGADVAFIPNGKGASDESITRIPPATRTSIANAIAALSRVVEDDEKN